MFFLYIKPHS